MQDCTHAAISCQAGSVCSQNEAFEIAGVEVENDNLAAF